MSALRPGRFPALSYLNGVVRREIGIEAERLTRASYAVILTHSNYIAQILYVSALLRSWRKFPWKIAVKGLLLDLEGGDGGEDADADGIASGVEFFVASEAQSFLWVFQSAFLTIVIATRSVFASRALSKRLVGLSTRGAFRSHRVLWKGRRPCYSGMNSTCGKRLRGTLMWGRRATCMQGQHSPRISRVTFL